MWLRSVVVVCISLGALLASASPLKPAQAQTSSAKMIDPNSSWTTPTSTSSSARPTCTVAHVVGVDDVTGIKSAISTCNSNSTIMFSAGVNYNACVLQ